MSIIKQKLHIIVIQHVIGGIRKATKRVGKIKPIYYVIFFI
jgi:hypothetical protein